MSEITTTKRSLRMMLLPFFELFDHKRAQLTDAQWLEFVESTRQRVLLEPVQFFGNDLPETSVLHTCIQSLFDEVIAEQGVVV